MHNRENQQKVRSFESSLEFQQLCEFCCFLRWGEHRTKLGDDVKRYMGYVRCDKLKKATAPHSSTLAWKIPWTQEPGRLQSMGSLRVGHD